MELPPTDALLDSLLKRYQSSSRPISVNFRKLVPIGSADYATHLLHPYPARLLVHIPYFFLRNSILSKRNDVVLDSFCGTGTVLLEALLQGRNGIGADTNPLARLIAKVKCKSLDTGLLEKALLNLQSKISRDNLATMPDVVNLSHWFYPHVIKQLQSLSYVIKSVEDQSIQDFLWVCFSRCVRKVSLADPRLSVPVRLRNDQYSDTHWLKERTVSHLNRLKVINVYKEFIEITQANIKRMEALSRMISGDAEVDASYCDSRNLLKDGSPDKRLKDASVDLILTSPPYAGAQKYIRASCLSLGWLELCPSKLLRQYESATIGREHFHRSEYEKPLETEIPSADRMLLRIRSVNPLRAHIMTSYLLEMRDSIREMKRVIKPHGFVVLILGNNQVCGLQFKTQRYVTAIAEGLGFKVRLELTDKIKYRSLMTKRNKTAGVIAREKIIILQKQ